jgi:hypothetical protein
VRHQKLLVAFYTGTVNFFGGCLLTFIGTVLFVVQLGKCGGADGTLIFFMLSFFLAPVAGVVGGVLGAVLDKSDMKIFAATLLSFIGTQAMFIFLLFSLPTSPDDPAAKVLLILSVTLSPVAGAVAGLLVWWRRERAIKQEVNRVRRREDFNLHRGPVRIET